jgi:hypothetical protein
MGTIISLYLNHVPCSHVCSMTGTIKWTGPSFDRTEAPWNQPVGLHGRVTEVFELVPLSLSQQMLLITITSKSYCCPTWWPIQRPASSSHMFRGETFTPPEHQCRQDNEADSVTMYSFYDVVDGQSLFSTPEPLRSGPVHS